MKKNTFLSTVAKYFKRNKKELTFAFLLAGAFTIFFFLNVPKINESINIGLKYVNLYAREHILFSLVPALFIAGAISQLVSTGPVIQILSGRFGRTRAYLVASISGSVLSVCSCTILPIFSGIYRTGAGIGPAIAFLFAGPAISVVAVAFTAVVIGWKLAIARIISAIIISILIGLLMEYFFKADEKERINNLAPIEGSGLAVWKSIIILVMMTLFLISATWSVKTADDASEINPMPGVETSVIGESSGGHGEEGFEVEIIEGRIKSDPDKIITEPDQSSKELGSYEKVAFFIYKIKWFLAGLFLFLTILFSIIFLKRDQTKGWLESTWDLAKEMIPLLFAGVFIAGFLFNIIPSEFIEKLFGTNSIFSSFLASILGVGTYFANCTEVAIIDVLMKNGMAAGPALSLLLAGPVVSPPSMIITWSILGPKKTLTYFGLVIIFSTLAGFIYGFFV